MGRGIGHQTLYTVPGEWVMDARCQAPDVDPELFFAPEGTRGRPRRDRADAAKAVCARCPVREACLIHALVAGEDYGVWGGLDELERKAVRA